LLSDAVDAFLESVSERAFDEPLLAILRAQGFERVHLVHGQREFGKDAIGQRDQTQWAWQSKAGDIGQGEWRALTGQLDELRLTNLGHGAFDTGLPRHPVLVTTGRLTGNAPDLFRDYNERARAKGEPELELWDRDTLIGFLAGNNDALLRGSMDGQLLAALGSIDAQEATMQSLEHFSRRWITWELDRLSGLGVIEAALLCDRLAEKDQIDLACHLALCLVRGAWAAGAGNALAAPVAGAAAQLFDTYAAGLWEKCGDDLLDPDFVAASGHSAWVTYPVRCTRIAELVGLRSLRLRSDDREQATEMAAWLSRFVEAQPGAAHPISDQYAVSLIPTALALAGDDPDGAGRFLKSATVWLCDSYERDRLGLASFSATPLEEIERLLGSSLESVEMERRRDSWIATVLLDLAATLGLEELYADIYNDLQAVGIYARALRLREGPDEFDRAGMGNRLDPNVDFAPSLEDQPVAPHHADTSGQGLCGQGRAWDLLAISSALRDRSFFCALTATAAT
jgi:hypothetical protein